MSNTDHATKEDLVVLNETIQKIQEKMDESKILNGGFDTIMFKIDYIQEKQEEANAKVEKVHEALYEPDQGFFARVRSIETTNNNIQDKMTEHLENDIKLFDDLKQTIVVSDKAVQVTKNLQSIAGERLQDIEAVVKMSKTFNKLFFLMFTGIVATIGKFIWDLYTARH